VFLDARDVRYNGNGNAHPVIRGDLFISPVCYFFRRQNSRVLAMVFSYSFDSAIRLTLDEAQGKAQEYVLFVSTIASLLEHCASTPFRRFVANTLPPTPEPFTSTQAPACFTRARSPFPPFLRCLLPLPSASLARYHSLPRRVSPLRPLSRKKEAFLISLISAVRRESRRDRFSSVFLSFPRLSTMSYTRNV